MIKDLTLLRTKTEWELELSDKKRYILISDVDEICGMNGDNTQEDCTTYTLIDCENEEEIDCLSPTHRLIVKEAIVEIEKFIYGEDAFEDDEEEEENDF